MNIYQKLAEIQKALMSRSIPKSGKNNYNHYTYHELEDILPLIFEECYKHECTLLFNFTGEEAILHLKSWKVEGECGVRDELTARVPFPPLESLNKGMNTVQSEGAMITYLKRYLLTNTFLIMEDEVVDSTGFNISSEVENKPKSKPETVTVDDLPGATFKVPNKIRNAVNLCKKNDGVLSKDGLKREISSLRAKGIIENRAKEQEYHKIIDENYKRIVEVLT